MTVVDRMHDLLLHWAGRVPDDFLASARQRLAERTVAETADALCLQLAERKVPVTIAQAGLLSELVGDSASAVFSGIPIRDDQPALEWLFAEQPATPEQPAAEAEATTAALIAVLSGDSAARGLWLSWRTPFRDGGTPLPVHVVEADDGLPALSAELHGA
ncbi:MAG: hypothetical protein IJH84_11890, partial [Saccharopolyspora sp.]|nr:hypothetical protein [Saccharopolyspora sp.]